MHEGRRHGPAHGLDNVVDMQRFRLRREFALPPELLEEVQAAARVYDALHAQGHEVRFELPHGGGRVRAELRSLDGDVVRQVPLAEVVGCDDFVAAA